MEITKLCKSTAAIGIVGCFLIGNAQAASVDFVDPTGGTVASGSTYMVDPAATSFTLEVWAMGVPGGVGAGGAGGFDFTATWDTPGFMSVNPTTNVTYQADFDSFGATTSTPSQLITPFNALRAGIPDRFGDFLLATVTFDILDITLGSGLTLAPNDFGILMNDTSSLVADWSTINVSAVPLPAAVWLLGSGLIGLAAVARRNKTGPQESEALPA